MKRLLLLTALVGCTSLLIAAQESELGRRIYSENASSVLLVYVRAPDGQYVAQGSGFLIGGSKIVTNAHVANAGKVFIELGSSYQQKQVELEALLKAFTFRPEHVQSWTGERLR